MSKEKGLRIITVTGVEFEVYGQVTWKLTPEDGKIYYCAGQSWPDEIVKEFIW